MAEVAAWLQRDPALVLLDVRDPDEQVSGCMAGALLLPRTALAARAAELLPDRQAPVVTYCGRGLRSVLAAQSLLEMGYTNVYSLRGGFSAWREAGQAAVVPTADRIFFPFSEAEARRYARHLRLPEIGVGGQQRLRSARILCVGAGGLGSPACLYLAAAGVGELGIVDDDVVDLSNLQRQVLHTSDRVGSAKVDSAAQTLGALNPGTAVTRIRARLAPDNAIAVMAGYDVIVDGSDNFATRYLVNDAALRLAIPVVHAAIQRFEGQLTVFAAGGAPCYRCLFPQSPSPDLAPSCEEAGVLGVLPGVMGVLQATEAIKLVLGIGQSLCGRLLTYDALAMRFSELRFGPDPDCSACGGHAAAAAILQLDG